MTGSHRRCRAAVADPLERRALLSTVTFGTPTLYGTGSSLGAAVVDLNGDGKADVVSPDSAEPGSDGVSVFLNNGDGTLGVPTTYTTTGSVLRGEQPYQVVAGDFNGDGHQDVASADFNSGTMSVLFGDGAGGLSVPDVYAADVEPDGIVTGDFNGDGRADLAVSDRGGNDVSVFLNQGNGTFGAAVNEPVGSGPANVAVGDLNGDGKPDLVTANADGTLSVLLNNGNGTFAAAVPVADAGSPSYVAVADVNGDGRADLVVAESPSGGPATVSEFLGTGTGTTFAPRATEYTLAGATFPSLVTGDFNNDGLTDVAVVAGGGDVSVLLGDGTGAFPTTVAAASGLAGYSVSAGDLNADGDPDLVVGAYDPGGTTSAFATLVNGGTGSPYHLAFARQPAPAAVGATLSPVVVDVEDASGTVLSGDMSNVNLSVDTGATDLSGTLSEQAVGGVATFSDLSVDSPGTFTLAATDADYGAAAASTPFTATGGGTTTPTPTPTPTATKTIGGLDPSFGTNGLASHDVGFTATAGVAADGAQSVLIGPTGTSPTESFGVTRYNADGSLDTAFGTGGVTTTAFAGADAVPTAVRVLADGTILVAGTATTYAGDGTTVTGSEFAVAEYTAAGAPDTAFGGGTGQAVVSFPTTAGAPTNDVLRALVVGPGGVIYLGGRSDAAGRGDTDFAVAALTAAGVPDAGFGTGGTVLADVSGGGDDAVNGLAVQANGDVVAAGSATVGAAVEVALARFTTAGGLDPRFGTKGVVTDKVGGAYDAAESVVIQPKGQVVIGGLTATGAGASLSSDFLVQRYTAAGRLDRTFGTGGTATTAFGQPAAVTQVVLQADGSIVASGKTTASLTAATATAPDVALVRYTSRGTPDAGFGGTGKVVIDLGAGVVPTPAAARLLAAAAVDLGAAFDAFTSSEQGVVAVTAGGEILTAGNSGADTVEAELVAAGVDLVAKLLSALPASVLGGAKGTATVTITENGTTPAAGSVAIIVAFAPSPAAAAAATKTFPERVNLKQGQARTYKLSFAYPAGLTSGGYYLVTTVTNGTGVPADLDAANNTAASPTAVTIAPAYVDLTGSALSATSAFAAGGAGKVSIDLTNGGNVTAKGNIDVDLYLSTDGTVAGGTPAGTVPLAVGLAAGKSHAYRLTFKLPSTLTAGTYTLSAVVDPDHGLGAADQTDATAVVAAASPVVVP